MTKLFAISKDGKHLGSIVAERIVCDPSDNYLLFLEGNRTVALFPAENITIESPGFNMENAISQFVEYQSNRLDS